MAAHVWNVFFKQGNNARDSRRDSEGVVGRRNRVHTLVAHHQVCQTLKENKSTVSREQGIVGSCVTRTRRHLVQSRCLCYSREHRDRKERDGEREEGTETGFDTMSIQSTGAGCDASSVTYSSSFGYLNSPPPCDWRDLPHPRTPARSRVGFFWFMFFTSAFRTSSCRLKPPNFQRNGAMPQLNDTVIRFFSGTFCTQSVTAQWIMDDSFTQNA